MTAPTISTTESAIMTALRAFLISILPAGMTIVQGQQNMVPEPVGPDFVVFWPLSRERLDYNTDTWVYEADPSVISRETDVRVTVQIDVHGPNSSDNAQLITGLWQDDFGTASFDGAKVSCRPLYAEDAQQIPFINAASQFEARYVIKACLQANIVISTIAEFADTLKVGLTNVEAAFPLE